MNYITSNIPYFKAWVRREYTTNHDRYHGEFIHAMVIGVTTLPMRTLSFQVMFTGYEETEENVHGGAMWARMPLTALVGDTPLDEWPEPIPTYLAQPWDCQSQHKQSHVLELLDAGKWTGNIVALPNNRVRVTNPAWFVTGEGAPDFTPSQWVHHSKQDPNYVSDTARVFDNLYAEK